MDYQERVNSYRKQLGLSQHQLADKAGLSRGTVGMFLSTPGREILVSSLAAIARALDVSLDWLVTGEQWRETQLTPDEDALLAAYRSATHDDVRTVVLETVRHMVDLPK